MKKFLLLVLTLMLSVGAVVAAPAPKFKKVKFNKYAYYEGMAVKKTPQGQGTLYPCSRCTVKGTFNNDKITNGEITFTDHKIIISGEFTLVVSADKQLEVIINKGKLSYGTRGGHWIKRNSPIKFTDDDFLFEDHVKGFPRLPRWYYDAIVTFAGEKRYSRKSDGEMKYVYKNEKRTREVITKSSYLELQFKNGTNARYDVASRSAVFTRANGDFVNFTISADRKSYEIESYRIVSGQTIITNSNLTHTFTNGNKYVGGIKDSAIADYVGAKDINKLASFEGLVWDWSNFENVASNGKITYADGKSEKVINGVGEEEFARREAERKAKEEAERKAREAAERKAKEEEAKRMKEYNALKASDFLKADYYNVPTSFKITYKDLAQLTYDETREKNELQLKYKNGDILYYIDSFMNAPTYNYFASLEYAPDIYSKDENGTRYFASDKLKVDITHSKLNSVSVYNPTNKSYIVYDSEGKLEAFKQTYSSGKFKSINTDEEKVIYADGSYFVGSFSVEVDATVENKLNADERLVKYGIKLSAGPQHVTAVKPYEGNVFNSAKKIIEIYRGGEKLTGSDFQWALSAEEAKIKKEEERKAQEAREKARRASLTKKYGAKFVSSLYDNDQLMEGMPIALVKEYLKDTLGENAVQFVPATYMGILRYDIYTSSGDVVYSIMVDRNNRVLNW